MAPLSSIRMKLLALAFFVQGAVAQYPDGKTFKPGFCNICRDTPNPNKEWRNLANPGQSFDMNGEKWSCGYLQETVQDINPYNGAPGEARMCAIAQTFANDFCQCSGPDIGDINDNVQQLNPACDLCEGQQMKYVPSVNSALDADTGIAGHMNCLGLYNAMAQGVLTSNLCPIVKVNAGPTCCSLESIQIGAPDTAPLILPPPVTAPTSKPCTSAAQVCETNADCCPGLQCKVKVFSGPKYCSASVSRARQSIAGAGVGGAAGRSRTGKP